MMQITPVAVTLLIVLAGFKGQLDGETVPPHEQVHFSAEDPEVEVPVEIPEHVLAILRNDEFVDEALQDEGIAAGKLPAAWFSASVVHLNNAAERDLVVVGRPPLAGANVVTFWIFRAVGQGYQLVLTAPAHDLFVSTRRWKAIRNIEMSAETAVKIQSVVYRFDGERYSVFRQTSKPIQ